MARNRLRDAWKSAASRTSVPLDETVWDSGHFGGDRFTDPVTPEDSGIPDRRLELMLVCAHPAIAASIRTPLMLQVVLGVDAAAIAAAFAVEPATMAQRLVRVKKRIRSTGIPFEMPEREQLDERLPAVLEAVYGAYAIDWQLVPQGSAVESLSAEAVHLALVLADLLPEEPEVLGLAALVCLSEARRPARRCRRRMHRAARGAGHRPLGSHHDRSRRSAADARVRRTTVPADSSTRRRSSPRTAAVPRVIRWTPRRCAPCIAPWFGRPRRWAPRSPLRRSTARSTALRRGCAPSMPCRPRRRTVPAGVGGTGASPCGGGTRRRRAATAIDVRSRRRRTPVSSNTSRDVCGT